MCENFTCIHCCMNPFLETEKVHYENEFGEPIWCGDFLCKECARIQPMDLIERGLLVIFDMDELDDSEEFIAG